MMKKIYLPILIFTLIGCLNNVEDVTGDVQSEVSFSADVQPILQQNCVSCHGSQGGIALDSYQSIITANGNRYGTNIVVQGDADASGLVDKIEANPQFPGRMPTGGPFLSGDEIQTIRAWINEGALNN